MGCPESKCSHLQTAGLPAFPLGSDHAIATSSFVLTAPSESRALGRKKVALAVQAEHLPLPCTRTAQVEGSKHCSLQALSWLFSGGKLLCDGCLGD